MDSWAERDPAGAMAASPFARFRDEDVADLVAEYPLAWVTARDGAAAPSLLPLLLECEAQGRPAALIGHMARHNGLVDAFTADPRALVLFTGPQSYMSPRLVSDPGWAPSWNYAQVSVSGTLSFQPDGGADALLRLTEALDRHEQTGWRPYMVGARQAAMERAIVAFRIDILKVEGRFKLGQDETPERLTEILARLTDPALVRWMRRFNPGRA